jgi:hypothetical protein
MLRPAMAAGYSPELWHELFVGVYTVRRPALDPYRVPRIVGVVTSQLATLPVVPAGASLVAQRGGGLYWLVPAIVLLLGVGVINAWVLLIEILR